MKKNYKKLSVITIILTVILVVIFSFGIPYYKNKVIKNKKGTLLKDAGQYYIVKNAVFDYYNLLADKNSYEELKKVILYNDDFTSEVFESVISSYEVFSIDIQNIYELGNNTYKCEYVVKQEPERLEGYIDYENLIDESVYNNSVIIRFNEEYDKYKVVYNRLELKGGNVYEE